MIASVLFIGLFMLSFVGAQDTCLSLGYECGTWHDDPDDYSSETTNCGNCINGACIVGKCYSSDEIGKCANTRFGESKIQQSNGSYITFPAGDTLPCNFFSIDVIGNLGDNKYLCEDLGCSWEDSSKVCSGNPRHCSELSLDKCTSRIGFFLDCKFEKTPYLKKLYWQVGNISNPLNTFAASLKLTRTKLNELEEGKTILIKIVYENSGLSEGTEVYFEIYSMGDAPIIIEHLEQELVGIRTGENSIKGVVDGKGDVDIQWSLSGEDLNLFDYDGFNYLSAELSLKNGTVIIPKGYLSFYTGFFRHNTGTIISYKDDIHNAFHMESVTAMCSGQNLVPCSAISSKSSCEFLAREFESTQGSEFIEDIEIEANCIWNEISNSCEGTGFSCAFLSDSKKDCERFGENYGCYWEADSFWIKFTFWLKNLFGF